MEALGVAAWGCWSGSSERWMDTSFWVSTGRGPGRAPFVDAAANSLKRVGERGVAGIALPPEDSGTPPPPGLPYWGSGWPEKPASVDLSFCPGTLSSLAVGERHREGPKGSSEFFKGDYCLFRFFGKRSPLGDLSWTPLGVKT